MAAQPESIIKRHCLQRLYLCPEFFGWVVTNAGIYDPTKKLFRARTGVGMMHGVSDVTGIWSGRGIALEIKTRTGKLSVHQLSFLQRFAQKGGLAAVLRSLDDTEELITGLRTSGKIVQRLQSDFLGDK